MRPIEAIRHVQIAPPKRPSPHNDRGIIMSANTRFEIKPFRRIYQGQRRYILAAAAYRSGSSLAFGERVFDFSQRKPDVVVSEIMLPMGAPEVFRNRSILWNAAETTEHWPDGLLARELVVDLPGEYSPTLWWNVTRGFANEHFVKRGIIVDFAVHLPELAGKHSAPHAHLLLTVRKVAAQGFTCIENSWREALHDPALKEAWRQAFAIARATQ
jgi:hypothetical protein